MPEAERSISNQHTGDTAGPVVQVGVVHGDVTIHAAPPRPDVAILVSVRPWLASDKTTVIIDGRSAQIQNQVDLFVEAFTAQAVILHRLRPVVVRRLAYKDVEIETILTHRGHQRKLRVDLDMAGRGSNLPEPRLYDVGLRTHILDRLRLSRFSREGGFPYYITASEPEYFSIRPHARSKAHVIEYRLELDWSSLGRHGTVVIDNNRTPFVFEPDTISSCR